MISRFPLSPPCCVLCPVSVFFFTSCVSLSVSPGDTLFIVLRKQKLIFLHWYHHITVLLYSWYSYKDMVAGGGWFMTMNYLVHAVMYSYYALRAAGFKVSRKFAMFITLTQITQMVMGCVVNYLVYSWMQQGQECPSHMHNIVWSSLMYLSYFVLFCQFFFEAYIGSKTKSRASSAGAHANHAKATHANATHATITAAATSFKKTQ